MALSANLDLSYNDEDAVEVPEPYKMILHRLQELEKRVRELELPDPNEQEESA